MLSINAIRMDSQDGPKTEHDYVAYHVEKKNRTSRYSTAYATTCLQTGKPIVFTKFGDGEVQCMTFVHGTNCDGDRYSRRLGEELNHTFIRLCDLANERYKESEENPDCILIGRWHFPHETSYLVRLYHHEIKNDPERMCHEIPFVHYHFIYNDDEFDKSQDLYDFVKAIQDFSEHKVFISNRRNERLQRFFKAHQYLEIASNSWYETSFDAIYAATDRILSEHPKALILIAGGLASKVLICRLCEKYPEASFLDIGSGFDIIGTGQKTRDHRHSYAAECDYYRDILPENW